MRTPPWNIGSAVERTTGVRVDWRTADPYPGLTSAAVVGLCIAVGFAIFGMPSVSIHGPLHYAGVMDPLCGMTRGTVATVRGDVRTALTFNPVSPLVPVGFVALAARWVAGRHTGRWVCLRYVVRPLPASAAVLALAALGINQQAHADLLGG
jgi:hypothetical protein